MVPKVLVNTQEVWLCPKMTETLLTGMLNKKPNQTMLSLQLKRISLCSEYETLHSINPGMHYDLHCTLVISPNAGTILTSEEFLSILIKEICITFMTISTEFYNFCFFND